MPKELFMEFSDDRDVIAVFVEGQGDKARLCLERTFSGHHIGCEITHGNRMQPQKKFKLVVRDHWTGKQMLLHREGGVISFYDSAINDPAGAAPTADRLAVFNLFVFSRDYGRRRTLELPITILRGQEETCSASSSQS